VQSGRSTAPSTHRSQRPRSVSDFGPRRSPRIPGTTAISNGPSARSRS
jgi:hypothetical protein